VHQKNSREAEAYSSINRDHHIKHQNSTQYTYLRVLAPRTTIDSHQCETHLVSFLYSGYVVYHTGPFFATYLQYSTVHSIPIDTVSFLVFAKQFSDCLIKNKDCSINSGIGKQSSLPFYKNAWYRSSRDYY
jgi:hypothetical protein